jgi:hypothetical protein
MSAQQREARTSLKHLSFFPLTTADAAATISSANIRFERHSALEIEYLKGTE